MRVTVISLIRQDWDSQQGIMPRRMQGKEEMLKKYIITAKSYPFEWVPIPRIQADLIRLQDKMIEKAAWTGNEELEKCTKEWHNRCMENEFAIFEYTDI